jgi:hypothetical protein
MNVARQEDETCVLLCVRVCADCACMMRVDALHAPVVDVIQHLVEASHTRSKTTAARQEREQRQARRSAHLLCHFRGRSLCCRRIPPRTSRLRGLVQALHRSDELSHMYRRMRQPIRCFTWVEESMHRSPELRCRSMRFGQIQLDLSDESSLSFFPPRQREQNEAEAFFASS